MRAGWFKQRFPFLWECWQTFKYVPRPMEEVDDEWSSRGATPSPEESEEK